MERLRFLRPEHLFSWPVFWTSFLWAVLVHVLDPEYRGYTGSLAPRIVLILCMHWALFAALYVVWRSILTRLPVSKSVIVLFFVIAALAALRGALMGEMLFTLHLVRAVDLLFRMTTSMTNMTLALTLCWVGVSGVRARSMRHRQLMQERDQLVQLQRRAAENLSELDDDAVEQIRASLLHAVDGLPVADPPEALRQLREVVDDVVRPLSRTLEAQSAGWAPPPMASYALQLDWARVLREASDPMRIHPAALIAFTVWITGPSNFASRGLAVAMGSVVHALVVAMPILWLVKAAAVRISANGSTAVRAVAYYGALIVGGSLIGVTSALYLALGPGNPWAYVNVAPLSAVIVGPLLAIAETAQRQAVAIDAELEATTRELRWSLARAREQHRQHRRALAHTLHGRVQASLASAILRLEMAGHAGEDVSRLLAALREDLATSIASMDFRTSTPEALDTMLGRVESTWQGVTDIQVDTDAAVAGCLAQDELCLTAINDLVPELVFNSIKHGHASNIVIRLRKHDERTISLEVSDDGASELPVVQRGMGTQLLDDCAISWRRDRAHGSTTTAVQLPYLAGSLERATL